MNFIKIYKLHMDDPHKINCINPMDAIFKREFNFLQSKINHRTIFKTEIKLESMV